MSHTTEIKGVQIKDIAALKLAVAELQQKGIKCELKENVKPRAFYPDQKGMGVAPYMLYLADSKYDIGFYPQADGTYAARTDLFGNQVNNILGVQPKAGEDAGQAQMGKLYQAYSTHATIRQCAKQGYKVQRTNRPDGTVALVVSV